MFVWLTLQLTTLQNVIRLTVTTQETNRKQNTSCKRFAKVKTCEFRLMNFFAIDC